MFNPFKKKKKSEDDEVSRPESEDSADVQADAQKTGSKKKKLFSKKLLIIILLVLICLGAAGFVVYKFYFSSAGSKEKERVYRKKEMAYVQLPEEMVRFCFDHLPELYGTLAEYNTQMLLLDKEIARIDAIGQAYPEQKKITDKEKKTWEKARQTLQKAFRKIEKPVKEAYVLFRVNTDQGNALIESSKADLTDQATEALDAVKLLTSKLEPLEKAPSGLIKGSIYKLKKKFL